MTMEDRLIGRTPDFESVNIGSTPVLPTINKLELGVMCVKRELDIVREIAVALFALDCPIDLWETRSEKVKLIYLAKAQIAHTISKKYMSI